MRISDPSVDLWRLNSFIMSRDGLSFMILLRAKARVEKIETKSRKIVKSFLKREMRVFVRIRVKIFSIESCNDVKLFLENNAEIFSFERRSFPTLLNVNCLNPPSTWHNKFDLNR